jgi:hypothetical protein
MLYLLSDELNCVSRPTLLMEMHDVACSQSPQYAEKTPFGASFLMFFYHFWLYLKSASIELADFIFIID